jgi:hypothetical protein
VGVKQLFQRSAYALVINQIGPILIGALVIFAMNWFFVADSWDSATIPIYEITDLDTIMENWFLDAAMFEQYVQVEFFTLVARFVPNSVFIRLIDYVARRKAQNGIVNCDPKRL